MSPRFYSDLYEIEDKFRQKKYQALLLSSLQNDMPKWTEVIKKDRSMYLSPNYNGYVFIVEIRAFNIKFAFISYKNIAPPITDRLSELICDDLTGDIKIQVDKLRETIYSPDIYEIEKMIGKQHDRKEKLDFLDVEQMKEIIEDTYQDWLKNDSDVVAKMISKIIYSYRRKDEIYELWTKKFENDELIIIELKKLTGK